MLLWASAYSPLSENPQTECVFPAFLGQLQRAFGNRALGSDCRRQGYGSRILLIPPKMQVIKIK